MSWLHLDTAVEESVRPLSRIQFEFCTKEFGRFCKAYETVGHKCTMINFVYEELGRELSRRIYGAEVPQKKTALCR